jgi:nucleolar protein 58
MGTEISEDDVANIGQLCDQVVALAEYRAQLYDYLKSRMAAVAPNLTVLVGELVGARLIAHVGSLVSLAKAPASTIQILGAEKALFRWAGGGDAQGRGPCQGRRGTGLQAAVPARSGCG